jgi:phosphoribosylformylglycinamidine cyclo-ligase
MATYKEAGVDIESGDLASKKAYAAAKSTFAERAGMIGAPVIADGGFAGLLDFGDFYLVQNDDGVGTKILIAEKTRNFKNLGFDLLAMVADDAICVGAEVTSITNTIDCQKVDHEIIGEMMDSLAGACRAQKVVIPGGEIAELNTSVNGFIWNASALGIIEKDKLIDGKNVQIGDKIIALPSDGFRANGFSLVRHILETNFGENYFNEIYQNSQDSIHSGKTWGEICLIPSRIYHNDLLQILGRYKSPRRIEIKAISHITGGGLRGNLVRSFPKGLGAKISNLPKPHAFMEKLVELGNVSREEAYQTWNMGIAMALVVAPANCNSLMEELAKLNISAQEMGEVVAGEGVDF